MPHPFRRLRTVACLTAALLLPTSLLAAAGDLDPTFGTGGKVMTPIGNGHDSGQSVAVQGDGKIVVAGFSFNGSNDDFALARYTAAGALDTTFGSGTGKVTTNVGNSNDYGASVATQSDGKILVAGRANNGTNYDFALVRYTSAGALDTSFGGGTGKVITPIGSGDDYGISVAVQADGKIVVAGWTAAGGSYSYDFALVRYTASGSLDTTFGGTGKVTTSLSTYQDFATSVAIQTDGKIVVAGRSSSNGFYYDFSIARYTDSGALDTTFGSGTGKVITAFGSGDEEGASVAVQGDGKIVVAGWVEIGSTQNFALVRYTDTGALDTNFGGGTGKVITFVTNYDNFGSGVAVQSDGKIVVAGYADRNGTAYYDFALVRYTDTGVLDTSFGGGAGKVTTPLGNSNSYATGMAIQGNGRIVVAGRAYNGSNYDFALARYLHSDAIPGSPPTFLEEPTAQTAFVGESVTFEALALGSPAPTYQWMKGSSPIDGETGTTLQLDGVTLEDAGSYSVVATNAEGSTPSASAALIVLQTSAPRIVQQPKDVRVKRGRSASFTVSATGTPPLRYQWYYAYPSNLVSDADAIIQGSKTAELTFFRSVASAFTDRYYVVVTDGLGQSVTSRIVQLAAAGKPLPAPRIKPESQSFSGTLTLEMTCAVPGAEIHYTTDGSPPDASSSIYIPSSPPVLTETSIVSAIALLPGSDRAQSPTSAVKRYFESSGGTVDLGALAGNRLSVDDALGNLQGAGSVNASDSYTFTTAAPQTLHISVSENTGRGPLTLEVVSPSGSTSAPVPSVRGGAIQWESNGSQPAGTYTVRVRLPDGLLNVGGELRHWPYRLTISGGPNWKIIGTSNKGTRVHHIGLQPLRPATEIVPGKPAWVVSHGRTNSPSSEVIDELARTLAGAEGDGTQVLMVDWETAAADNTLTGLGVDGAQWIKDVGSFIAERLVALQITGAKLSVAGHSWGTYVVHEASRVIGERGATFPRRLVALDPALVGGGKGINFSAISQYSWGFYSSKLGHEENAASASDAFVVGSPFLLLTPAHRAAVTAFSRLLQQHLENPGDMLAARFGLDRFSSGYWVADQVAVDPLILRHSLQVAPLLRSGNEDRRTLKLFRFEAGLVTDDSGSTTQLVVP